MSTTGYPFDGVTGYPLDNYDGTDESFERLLEDRVRAQRSFDYQVARARMLTPELLEYHRRLAEWYGNRPLEIAAIRQVQEERKNEPGRQADG